MSAATSPPPKVTVIIIFLNAERFIRDAIESVFSQSYTDWELLLVDDGSVDGSTAIARQCAAAGSGRVRYLEHAGHANRGMSAARNLGLMESRGEYIAFLDSDDTYLPDRLDKHVRILDALPQVQMVQSDCIKWHSWMQLGFRADDDLAWPFPCLGDRLLEPPLGLLSRLALRDLYIGICSITVRRDAALAVGGFEEEFRTFYEDEVFLAKIYLRFCVYARNDYVARYRIHAESACGQVEGTAHLADGPSRIAGRVFHSWLRGQIVVQVASDETRQQLVAVLQDGSSKVSGSPVGRWALDLGARVRRLADWVASRALSPRHYQLVKRWRREKAFRRASVQYAGVCETLTMRAFGAARHVDT